MIMEIEEIMMLPKFKLIVAKRESKSIPTMPPNSRKILFCDKNAIKYTDVTKLKNILNIMV
jgi:hypothetical protein